MRDSRAAGTVSPRHHSPLPFSSAQSTLHSQPPPTPAEASAAAARAARRSRATRLTRALLTASCTACGLTRRLAEDGSVEWGGGSRRMGVSRG